jgi:hypothetical protein
VIAFAPAQDKQGWKTLHKHWQMCVEELSSQVHEDLWNANLKVRNEIT